MQLPDDLDEYLSGDSTLSKQYRKEYSPMPPQLLDRRVAELAVSRGSPRAGHCKSACLAPLAFAASVLLSVALVLAIVFGPQKAKRADGAPHLVRVATALDGRLRLYSSDPSRPRTPAQWLADIAALRRAGRVGEADVELRRFRATYPTYAAGDAGVWP
jgi:hypothetical protein